jgi:hypothetical protein
MQAAVRLSAATRAAHRIVDKCLSRHRSDLQKFIFTYHLIEYECNRR